MAKYIDKSAVVAEIKGYISNYKEIVAKTNRDDSTWVDSVSMIDAKIGVLQHLLAFLDTLEVKEIGVDLGVPQGDKSVKYIIDTKTFEVKDIEKEPISEDLEEAARRIATRHSHITGDTYYANDAWFFKKGAQWQKEQMINKACKWLKSYRQDTPDGIGYVAGIVNDKTIEEFKKAMEE